MVFLLHAHCPPFACPVSRPPAVAVGRKGRRRRRTLCRISAPPRERWPSDKQGIHTEYRGGQDLVYQRLQLRENRIYRTLVPRYTRVGLPGRQLHWAQSEVLEAGSRTLGAINRKSVLSADIAISILTWPISKWLYRSTFSSFEGRAPPKPAPLPLSYGRVHITVTLPVMAPY